MAFTQFGDGSWGYITTDDAGKTIATTKIKDGVAVRETISGSDGNYSVDDRVVRELFRADDVLTYANDNYVHLIGKVAAEWRRAG